MNQFYLTSTQTSPIDIIKPACDVNVGDQLLIGYDDGTTIIPMWLTVDRKRLHPFCISFDLHTNIVAQYGRCVLTNFKTPITTRNNK